MQRAPLIAWKHPPAQSHQPGGNAVQSHSQAEYAGSIAVIGLSERPGQSDVWPGPAFLHCSHYLGSSSASHSDLSVRYEKLRR